MIPIRKQITNNKQKACSSMSCALFAYCYILVDIRTLSSFGSPDKPGGLSIQLCKSEKKEFYIRYSS